MMSNLRELVRTNQLKGKQLDPYIIDDVDEFRYVDPVDQSVTEKQVRLSLLQNFSSKACIMFRKKSSDNFDSSKFSLKKFSLNMVKTERVSRDCRESNPS